MIEIEAEKTGLRMKGHAGQAEKGKDIVCAGATAILYALVYGLDQIGELGECDLASGKAMVSAETGEDGEPTPEAKGMLRMAMAGLELITNKYPEYAEMQKNF